MNPSGSARPATLASADAALTRDRQERKYFVSADAVAPLARTLSRHLLKHRYGGPGANRLPNPQHFSTTVYFDTPSHALLRQALSDPENNLKLRCREYYDLHPSLAEVAVDPRQMVHYQPSMWLELKSKLGARTRKARLELEKRDVPGFFRGDHPAWSSASDGSADDESAHAIVEACRSLNEPLQASCLINYRRLAFQDPAGHLRVTLDLDLAFYAPPDDLWTRRHALLRHTLGQPRGQSRQAIVEVKRHGPAAAWLEAMLAEAGVQSVGYSKFVAGAQAVHGAP